MARKSQNAESKSFLTMPPLEVPQLMTNVVGQFIHGIPPDSYAACAATVSIQPADTDDPYRDVLTAFVRARLPALALFEYASWVNGRLPFVTSRELQLWRLLQFVKYMWFWDLPQDDVLAMIFNLTRRKAANLSSDFEARFRKTILYPVALRRLYDLLSTEPREENVLHPKGKNWDGCIYRVDSDRYLGYALSLTTDLREESKSTLAEPMWYDRDELLLWVPMEMRDLALRNSALRYKLFDIYRLPAQEAEG